MNRLARLALTLAVACGLAACDRTPPPPADTGVTDAMIANPPEGEWLSYGRDHAEQRFSPLQQIDAENVGELGLVWSHDFDTSRGQEATPLMHDGVLYTTSAWSKVYAFDARNGELLWSFDPKVPRETLARACCDAVNRGVALYADKVFVATLDGRLIALKQDTGRVVWSKTVVPNQQDYTITGAPRVAGGRVLIGSGGAEFKARGFIAAFDHVTGNEVWRFHTVPGNPDDGFENAAMTRAANTWSGEWWKTGGGGTVWDAITYDPVTNLVLFGTGNAEPWNPEPMNREGAALFTSSIVAVDAATGEYKWHYQTTPGDQWDYDSAAQITLLDAEIEGSSRRLAVQANKNGFFYAVDARTGQFIDAAAFAEQNWAEEIDEATGKPKVRPEARYHETGELFIGMPGATGAHNWQPMSFSPETGLVYIPVIQGAFPYAGAEGWEPSKNGFQTGMEMGKTAMPADTEVREGALAANTGALVAWDPIEQREAWRVDLESPWNGGTLATAGNLVFQGNAAGEFAAYSAHAGEKLWSFPAQSGIIAAPMTYAIGGEQYVAIMVGWGGVWDVATGVLARKGGSARNISRLLVFKLGARGRLPDAPEASRMVLDPPAFTGTQSQAMRGAMLYGRYCAVCRGDAAVAGGLNPDLRHSGAITSAEAMREIVIGGALAHRGMVSYADDMGNDDAEAIRQYLIFRANEDKALEEDALEEDGTQGED